jgi:hypothetical protein
MRLTQEQIEGIRRKRPTTHELGGVFALDEAGNVVDVNMSAGGKCRHPDGTLIPGVKNCSVVHGNGTAVWHTHPRANRPSSGDLRNAVLAYPERAHNFVFTPAGVWAYAPTPELKARMDRSSVQDQRRLVKEWRFLGHMHQRRTQDNDCNPFLDVLNTMGFRAQYRPYDQPGDWEL